MFLFFIPALLLAVFLEGTVTTLPLVLLVLLCLTIVKRTALVFPIAFVTGLILDIVTVRIVGVSSLFFLVFVFLILLYQRKYEINSYPFVAVAGFLGAIGYGLIFGGGNIFFQALISAFIAIMLFKIFRKV